jgi:hypothetical protein
MAMARATAELGFSPAARTRIRAILPVQGETVPARDLALSHREPAAGRPGSP